MSAQGLSPELVCIENRLRYLGSAPMIYAHYATLPLGSGNSVPGQAVDWHSCGLLVRTASGTSLANPGEQFAVRTPPRLSHVRPEEKLQ